MRLWGPEGGAWGGATDLGLTQQAVIGPGCKRQVAPPKAVVWGSCRSLKFARNFWKLHPKPITKAVAQGKTVAWELRAVNSFGRREGLPTRHLRTSQKISLG